MQALTGASYRQMDYWTSCGFIRPSIERGVGSGNSREWSTEDAVKVAAMLWLIAAGVSPERAAPVMPTVGDGSATAAVMTAGPLMIFVDLGRIRDYLTDARDLRWLA